MLIQLNSNFTLSKRDQLGCGCPNRTSTSSAITIFGGNSLKLQTFSGKSLNVFFSAKIIQGEIPVERA